MLSLRRIIIALLVVAAGIPAAMAASATMNLGFAPHCTEEDRSLCPQFEVTSPLTVSTGMLEAGEILDIDIVVTGKDYRNVRAVRSWIKYDKNVLEARSVELTSAVPSPTPGEQNIDAAAGIVKIGGSVENGFSSETTAIARVTFRVLGTTSDTVISFDGYNADGTGRTAVNGPRVIMDKEGVLPAPPCIGSFIGCKGVPQPLLAVEPGTLAVALMKQEDSSAVPQVLAADLTGIADAASSASASSESSVMSSSSSAVSSSAGPLAGAGSTFSILQVQGVKVTTRDTTVFLGWNDLKSSELTGYNVYYGTVSGRYIQRRSIPATAASLVLRDLQIGTTYYFAVRGVNAQNQETVFSQEVSVTVGKPETATSPLSGTFEPIGTSSSASGVLGNPVQMHGGRSIGGDTGVSDIVFLLAAASAVVGTFFAFRRQTLLLPHVR